MVERKTVRHNRVASFVACSRCLQSRSSLSATASGDIVESEANAWSRSSLSDSEVPTPTARVVTHRRHHHSQNWLLAKAVSLPQRAVTEAFRVTLCGGEGARSPFTINVDEV